MDWLNIFGPQNILGPVEGQGKCFKTEGLKITGIKSNKHRESLEKLCKLDKSRQL